MRTFYTEKEIRQRLKEMAIICDTREQVNYNIISYLDAKHISYIERKLDVGDYAFQCGGQTYETDVAVERKANLDELAGNLTADRKRFEQEMIRAKARGTKVFLLIENASWQDIYAHDYKSKLEPKSMIGTLLSWQARYNVTILFCRSEESPKLIHGIFYYWLKNALEGGV